MTIEKFFVGVAGVLEKNGQVLVLRRSAEKDVGANLWEVVTGRLEAEENPEIGILREIEEEVGLKAEVVMPINTKFFYRGGKDFPMILISFWCRYLSGEVKISCEHSEFKWMKIDDAINNSDMHFFTEEFKRIKQLKENFEDTFRFVR
ncbi:MAG: NUDIX domain-containing protein [Candidatus Heimdallarchaeota archaeon]